MIRIITLLSAAFMLFIISCATAPEEMAVPDELPEVEREAVEFVTAEREKESAEAALEKSRSIKAHVAVREDFAAAMELYNEGIVLFESGPEEALNAQEKFRVAEAGFIDAYEKAYAKREAALRELEQARDDIRRLERESEELERLEEEGAE